MGSKNKEKLIVSHLLFADNTQIFCKQIVNNFIISDFYSYVLSMFQACILGCRVASLSIKYLSLPLGASYKTASI